MKERIVTIKVPILLECDALTVKDRVIEMFGKNIYSGLDYRENLSNNDKIEALKNQYDIISKIGYKPYLTQ